MLSSLKGRPLPAGGTITIQITSNYYIIDTLQSNAVVGEDHAKWWAKTTQMLHCEKCGANCAMWALAPPLLAAQLSQLVSHSEHTRVVGDRAFWGTSK